MATKNEVVEYAPDSPEAKAMLERMKREQAEGEAYVRKHGGRSTEGFIRTPDGPTSVE